MGRRIQNSILAKPERKLLNWLCVVLPEFVTPDRLTLLGLAGAVAVFVGYALSNWNHSFLWVAILGYPLNWFGDSLDGALARFRSIERPRYGYFVDHSVDTLGSFLIMTGLGLTGYVRMDVALFALVGYLLMSIFVYLKNQALDEFQLSFLVIGPTELRVCLVASSLLMLFLGGPVAKPGSFSIYDFAVGGAGALGVLLFVIHVVGTAGALGAAARRDRLAMASPHIAPAPPPPAGGRR